MTINTDLLVSAAMLQDYIVDKDSGTPLTNGIITLWQDTARYVNYKNWYYQTGVPGAYTWIPLDNPLRLSNSGTIQDPNGNDVIPFYYPYEEDNENVPQAYYITVYSADENGDPDVLQFTRENFPFQPSNVNPTASNPTWRNYILNNVYWRNIGSLDCMNVTDQVIAPSQHEGYVSNPDIRFLKNVTGADDDLIFSPMTTSLDNDITPEYYLNFTCNSVQVGETQKCIQYPIALHVKTLQNVNASVVFQGQNVAGNTNNFVDLYLYQFLGSGAITQPAPILIKRVTLGNVFQKFIIPFTFPDASNLTLGGGGDDALFLQVQYPLSALCAINHTKPQLYLSADVPDNDFDTYDQIETIINSQRTGDTRISVNAFSPFGWIPANDGTIGSASSGATRANIDTWPLFSLLWTNVSATYAPIYTSTGAASTRGATAIADFTANKRISLTKALGQTFAGTTNSAVGSQNFTTSGASATDLVVTDASSWSTATPVVLTGVPPAGLSTGVRYFTIYVSTTHVQLATTIPNALNGIPIHFTAGVGAGSIDTIVNTLGFPGEQLINAGGGAAIPIDPPFTFMNVFFKL